MEHYEALKTELDLNVLQICPGLLSDYVSCVYFSSHPSRCSSRIALSSSNEPKVTSLLGRIFPQPFTWLTLCTHSNASFSKRPSLTTPNNGGPLSLVSISLSLFSFITLHSTWQYPFYYSLFSHGLLPPMRV